MTMQATLTSESDGIVGTIRLTVADPGAELARVEFYTTVASGARLGPFVPDRTSALGAFEKDVLLDTTATTLVEAIATKLDDSTLLPTPASVTLAVRSVTVPPRRIRALNLMSEHGRVDVSVVLGSAFSWKCWMRHNAWPTTDATAGGTVLEEYVRFEGNRDKPTFSLPLRAGNQTWFVVIAGTDSAGAAGPRLLGTVDARYGAGVHPALRPYVELDSATQKNRIHWQPNDALSELDSSDPSFGPTQSIEVFRAGKPESLGVVGLTASGIIDDGALSCTPGTSSCDHKTYEYRVLLLDKRDGSIIEFATSLSGSYQSQ